MLPWFESLVPSPSAEPPRAWLRTDAPALSLDGPWRFRYSPRADGPEDFAGTGSNANHSRHSDTALMLARISKWHIVRMSLFPRPQ